MSTAYNLLEEKWIPVLWSDGRVDRVGIKEALTRAQRIRQITASNPMDRVAILRFLLALLYWCKGNPPANGRRCIKSSFPAEWFSKLDENKESFNLLGAGKRFYQYRGAASPTDKKLSANYLIHEVPTGTNCWHFRHSTDNMDGLCLACCALGLLRLPIFATSGGKGKSPGVNLKPPLYVVPLGFTLADTLRLSWRPVENLGTPAWETPDMKLPQNGDVPLLTGLTWLPRRVWLDEPSEPTASCISCGSKCQLVRECVFAGRGSTKTDGVRNWRDPHVIYQAGRQGKAESLQTTNSLTASDGGASQWAGRLASIIQGRNWSDADALWFVEFSTAKSDQYLEATECFVPWPASTGCIQATAELLSRWQKEGSKLGRTLGCMLLPQNSKKIDREHPELKAGLAVIRPNVEHGVSANVAKLLGDSDDAWQQAAREYSPMMTLIAKSLSPGVTTAAVERRKQISDVMPDMRPKADFPAKAKSAKKRSIKKGAK